MRNKSALITSGCGIAGVFLLDRNRVPKEFAGKIRKRAKRNGSPQVQFLVRDILMFMDHRSNGEGAGIAIYRKTSSLYKSSGFPLVYTPSEDNLFILNVLASTRSEVDPLKELASNMGIEVIRIQDKEKNSRARKDVLLDMNMYEIAVIVRNDRESNFVQFCNVVNGRRNAPKIISGNVNSGIFKGVGRIDDLFDYFPELHRREVTGAIGHVRYPTNTPDGCLTAQPHWGITYDGREIITSYSSQNGEITNNHSLRSFLGGERFFPVIGLKKTRTLGSDGFNSMLTESDGELIPNLVNYLLAKGYSQKEVADVLSGHREPETGRGMLGISGPVAAACSSNLGVIAFRDPRRLRPLIGAVAQDANGAYLIIASEESAIRYGCGKNGFDVLKIWEVRDNVFAGRDGCFLDLPEENETMFAERIVAERIPLLPVGGESLRRDPRGQESAPTDGFLPHPNSVTLDLAELRKDIEALSDEELFDLARFEGDNGKFLEDRQTYANRYVIRKIREEILNAVSQLRDAGAMKEKTELSVNLKNLLGERHLIAGTIGFLARKLSCDLPLAMAYRTEGTAGDNFAAFTSWRTRVFHRGNCGENLGNTACGSSIAVDGDARGALGYACFGSTKIFISGSAGVRAGAYMKGTSKENPAIIIGGTAGKWCGECAHHGKLIVLNLGGSRDFIGSGAGAGMEGSARVFVRAPLSAVTGKVGTGVRARGISGAEREEIKPLLKEFLDAFGLRGLFESVVSSEFTVIEKVDKANNHSSRRFVSEPVYGKEEAKIVKLMANEGMGGVYLSRGMGARPPEPALNAAQVTAPGIDDRETPSLKEMLFIPFGQQYLEGHRVGAESVPRDMGTFLLYVDGQSFGALGEPAWMALYRVTRKMGILFCSGEGGLPPTLKDPSPHLVRQVASGRFGIKTDALAGDDFVDYFKNVRFIEIKIGQGAKPGRGGRLPDEKVTADISMTRGVDEGTSALSPPSHHDTYSIEDVKKLIELMRIAAGEQVRVIVKIAATNDLEQIVSGLVKGNANAINISGGEGGTGSATRESNQTGMTSLRAIGRAHERLMKEGLRNYVILMGSGGIFDAYGIISAMSKGANLVAMATALNIAMNCVPCEKCDTGKCPSGITTSEKEFLEKLPPDCEKRVESYITSLGLGVQSVLQQNGVMYLPHATGNGNLLIEAIQDCKKP